MIAFSRPKYCQSVLSPSQHICSLQELNLSRQTCAFDSKGVLVSATSSSSLFKSAATRSGNVHSARSRQVLIYIVSEGWCCLCLVFPPFRGPPVRAWWRLAKQESQSKDRSCSGRMYQPLNVLRPTHTARSNISKVAAHDEEPAMRSPHKPTAQCVRSRRKDSCHYYKS